MSTKLTTLASMQKLFAATPAKQWTVGSRHEGNQRCAIGIIEHKLGLVASQLTPHHPSFDGVFKLFEPLATERTTIRRGDWALADVNNGYDARYKQKTPKGRVLAAMRDLIAKRY